MRIASLLFHDVYARDPSESGFFGVAADRYKLPTAAFDRALDAVSRVWASPPVVGCDLSRASDGEASAITVDDGGESYLTIIADRLEQRGWRGYCFVCTDAIGRRGFLDRRQVRELDARGHTIGAHSASHPSRFSACSWEQMLTEWRSSRSVLEDVLGHAVTIASLPGGYLSSQVARAAHESGIETLFTSEPDPVLRSVEGCTLAGRFAIRPGFAPARIAALAACSTRAIWRERTLWNAKKLIRPVLGPLYPQICRWRLSGAPDRRAS